jgi:hypothetical protein
MWPAGGVCAFGTLIPVILVTMPMLGEFKINAAENAALAYLLPPRHTTAATHPAITMGVQTERATVGATDITAYLDAGGRLENAHALAARV